MVDLGGAGRTSTTVYQGLRGVRRILQQRRLFSDIRYEAVVIALQPDRKRDDPTPPHISQAAKLMCDELDYTEIPEERSRGFMRGVHRRVRENVTYGIRYPEYRHGMNSTFFRRMGLWALRAAETDKGREALDLAGVPLDPDRERLFADRFWVATYGLLMDTRGPSDGEEALRAEITNEILHGVPDRVRMDRYRLLQDVVNSAATSIVAAAGSYFGFQQNVDDALALGGFTFIAATGVTGVRHLRNILFTEKMQEARRQARNWLLSLHAWMVGYVVWGEAAAAGGQYAGIDQLAYIARALASREAHITPDMPRDEILTEDIKLLIENSERAEDGELTAALMRLQGALLWRSEHLGSAIGNLIATVQTIPITQEESTAPIQLPRAREPGSPQLPGVPGVPGARSAGSDDGEPRSIGPT
ncbi:hypothetical protein ACWGJT_11755 [Streptomyces xantholiticus]